VRVRRFTIRGILRADGPFVVEWREGVVDGTPGALAALGELEAMGAMVRPWYGDAVKVRAADPASIAAALELLARPRPWSITGDDPYGELVAPPDGARP
jgi:hypothetical protein